VKEAYLRGTEDNSSASSLRLLVEVYIDGIGAENSMNSTFSEAAYRGVPHRTLVLQAGSLMC
jgi:hypothetical protein